MIRTIEDAVDALGRVRARMSRLAKIAANLEDMLKDSGREAIDGRWFRATVSRYTSDVVAWKKVALRAGASQQLITAHTKETPKTTVRVNALLKTARPACPLRILPLLRRMQV